MAAIDETYEDSEDLEPPWGPPREAESPFVLTPEARTPPAATEMPPSPEQVSPSPVTAPPTKTTPTGRPLLEAALAGLLPQQSEGNPASETTQAPASTPRVQLGFRDGTSTVLDPASDQSQLLQQLAQSLTNRD